MSCMSSPVRRGAYRCYRCRCGIYTKCENAETLEESLLWDCGIAGNISMWDGRFLPDISLQLSWSKILTKQSGMMPFLVRLKRSCGNPSARELFSGCKSPLARTDMHCGPVDGLMSVADDGLAERLTRWCGCVLGRLRDGIRWAGGCGTCG